MKAENANSRQSVAEAILGDLRLPMERPSRIEEGSRDDTLYRWACSCFARGLTFEETLADCLDCNSTFCPPLDGTTVLQKVESASKYETELADPLAQNRQERQSPSQGGAPAQQPPPRRDDYRADLGNARKLVKLYTPNIRYLSDKRSWMWWDEANGVWTIDSDGAIMRCAKYTLEMMLKEAVKINNTEERKKQIGHIVKSMQKPRLEAMVGLASTEQEVVCRASDLDADPWLAGLRGGHVIALKTGVARKAKREDYITRQLGTAYDSKATCPKFDEFFGLIFAGDQEVIDYVWRCIGYTLTGLTVEEIMFILWESGLNGKTAFCNVLYALMGDYAVTCDVDVIMERDAPGRPSPELMQLKGARLASVNETKENQKLSERRIKYIVSHERITARNLHEGLVTFLPTHKVWLRTNHLPVITGTDLGIWRRIGSIRFPVNIKEAVEAKGGQIDRHYCERCLLPELPGILNRALAGLQAYRMEGLNPPAIIQRDTAAYRKSMDFVERWLADCCAENDGYTYTADAYEAFAHWYRTEISDKYLISKNRFGRIIREKFGGDDNDKEHGDRVYRGFELRPDVHNALRERRAAAQQAQMNVSATLRGERPPPSQARQERRQSGTADAQWQGEAKQQATQPPNGTKPI
ncbi:MAG TPA: phage/plasmid primase, P4 family [Xanthobacteraceae bacterium]|nr:phage/plasmid primase, P4 family [Xanthobacteraceae bacterium]